MKRALVRRPGPRLAEGLVTYLDRQHIDLPLALQQWQAYVDALDAAGWEVIEVPTAPDSPDAVFVEDTAVVFHDHAVIGRPGAVSRRDEVGATAAVLEQLGYACLHLDERATLDGGDVLKVGRTVYVGLSGRTNRAAAEQLATHLEPRGWTVSPVPVTKTLHLKSALTALPDGTIIGWEPFVDDPARFARFVAMPEETGAHVVDLGEHRLLIDASAVASRQRLTALGYEPVPVEIGEFVKLEGCVTCLSIRLRDRPGG